MAVNLAADGLGRRVGEIRWGDYVVYFGFVLIFAYFATTQTEYFLTATNLKNVAVQATPIAVMAIGVVFVLSSGEIDISFGSTVALAALVAAMVMEKSHGWWLAVLAALAVGIVVGLVNGLLVTWIRLPSFLVTLATLGLISGIARELTDLRSVAVVNHTFIKVFGSSEPLGIPVHLIWLLLVALIGWHVLRQRRFGAHVLAVGDNAASARVSGVKVNHTRLAVFVISATTAAIAGLLYAGRLQGARYTLGDSDLMTVIAAVIVGGTSLFGGKGTIVGAVVGSLMMAMINNGLILAGLTVSQQMIVRGVIILVAVSFSLRAKKDR